MTHFMPILPDELLELQPEKSDSPNTLIDKYAIDIKSEITEKSTPYAKVYKLQETSITDEQDNCAVVFENFIVPRIELIQLLYKRNLPCVPPLLDTRIVFMTTTNLEHYCLVTETTNGVPLANVLKKEEEIPDNYLKNYIILPLARLLKELEDLEIGHGSLNINSLFLDSNNRLMTSECVSSLPGYYQDNHYETIDRAMIKPIIAKGEPKPSDDFYAVGVILAVILAGHNIFEGLDPEAELMERIKKGSYNTLSIWLMKITLP
ncbi:MAG: hypothetical protein MK137_09550 [Rickettsiales bacterium]|nr:hypothetical protein [Rickettsiales bacterium]